MTISDRIAVMNAGRIEQIGTARDLQPAAHAHSFADFIGEINLFDRRVARRRFHLERNSVAGAARRAVRGGTIAIRPERVRLTEPHGATLRGRIENQYVYFGTDGLSRRAGRRARACREGCRNGRRPGDRCSCRRRLDSRRCGRSQRLNDKCASSNRYCFSFDFRIARLGTYELCSTRQRKPAGFLVVCLRATGTSASMQTCVRNFFCIFKGPPCYLPVICTMVAVVSGLCAWQD